MLLPLRTHDGAFRFHVAFALFTLTALTAVFCDDSSSTTAETHGNRGALVICGGGRLPDSVRRAFVSRVPRNGTVVLLATAASDPVAAADAARLWLRSDGVDRIATPEFSDVSLTASEGTVEQQVAMAVDSADAVWIGGGQQSRLAKRYVGTEVEAALSRLLERGGTIGGTSAGAAIMSRVMIASGRETPILSRGLDLLPGAIIDQHFTQRGRIDRSRAAVKMTPGNFGLGIDESTAAVVEGRTMTVVGDGTVTVLFNQDHQTPVASLLEVKYRDGDSVELTADEWLADQKSPQP